MSITIPMLYTPVISEALLLIFAFAILYGLVRSIIGLIPL